MIHTPRSAVRTGGPGDDGEVTNAQSIPDAVQTIASRALEVRELFGEWEQAKYGRQWSVSDLLNGFVVDVGDLARLVMAATGARHEEDVPARLAHEFADCLWSVLVLAARLDVDLGAAFATTMDDLESFLRSELESPG